MRDGRKKGKEGENEKKKLVKKKKKRERKKFIFYIIYIFKYRPGEGGEHLRLLGVVVVVGSGVVRQK